MDDYISLEIDKRIERCKDNNHVELIQLNRTLRELAERIEDHVNKEEDFWVEIREAFPEQDTIGHKHYHELVIKREEKRAALQDAIIEKTVTGLLWAAIVGVGAALWSTDTKAFCGDIDE